MRAKIHTLLPALLLTVLPLAGCLSEPAEDDFGPAAGGVEAGTEEPGGEADYVDQQPAEQPDPRQYGQVPADDEAEGDEDAGPPP